MIKEIIRLIDDKIAEAKCCEVSEIDEQYLEGYINGLKMAKLIINEENGYVKGGGKYA